jgi:transcription elongation factor GreA
MAEKPTYLTAAGKRKLEEELHHLVTVRRVEVSKQIQEAKDGGDITENAGYDEAKYQQGLVEGRIRTLEGLLSNVEIIETAESNDKVCMGSTVTILEQGGAPEVFRLVGATESDPLNGRISDESPLGRSLMGHGAGDHVVVNTPDGQLEYEILGVN